MINDPLAQKLYQGGYKNYTEGRVNSYTKPLGQKVDQEQQTVLQETENNNDDDQPATDYVSPSQRTIATKQAEEEAVPLLCNDNAVVAEVF